LAPRCYSQQMRTFAVVVSFVALIANGVLSVVVYKLHRNLAETRGEVVTLRAACREERAVLDQAGRDDDSSFARGVPMRGPAPVPRLAPAALAPSAGSAQAGGAPSLASPEVKAEVQKMVAEQLADEQRRREGMREQRDQQMRERMAMELGLNQAEKERFLSTLTSMQAERQALREQERSGEKTMLDIRPQMEALRQKTNQSLREILGDERMQKYQDLRGGGRGMAGGPPGPVGP